MKALFGKLVAVVLSSLAFGLDRADAGVVFDQPGGGAAWLSSWWSPNGSDYDQYTWDNFSISSNVPITEIRWHGGFAYGSGGPVTSFDISIYSSIGGNSQPDIGNVFAPNPLVTYTINGDAGQTPPGSAKNVSYDYDYVLPVPFQAVAGAVYWIQIEAAQSGIPDWALGAGVGDGRCFRKIANVADTYFYIAGGDVAFTLLTTDSAIYGVSAATNPVSGGSVTGIGLYPESVVASLTAVPSSNFAFVNWTLDGAVVSSSPNYSFSVSSNTAFAANFASGSSVSTLVSPPTGGSVTGGGSFTNGAVVTLSAVTNMDYSFVNWTEGGVIVSTTEAYTFVVASNRNLTANFSSATAIPAVYYSQPPAEGAMILSSFLSPDGMDGDNFAFDDFALPVTQDITEIRWFGAYKYGNMVSDFTVKIYSSITGGSLPDIGSVYTPNPLASYDVGGNAGENLTNGIYTYDFVLPSAFHALAGARYWVQIEAFQTAYPNGWSLLHGANGNGRYFLQITGSTTSEAAGDAAFMLVGEAGSNSCNVVTASQPSGGGSTTGDGRFGIGVTNIVNASPNGGFIFVGWAANGAVVSTNMDYTFAVSTNTMLTAIFNPVFSVTADVSPVGAGLVSGAGTFPALTNVTVVAVPNPGYTFANWSVAGTPVSHLTNYSFNLNTTQLLTANFIPAPLQLYSTLASDRVEVYWSPALSGWQLQESLNLVSWTNSSELIITNGGQQSVSISPASGNRFFRLFHP